MSEGSTQPAQDGRRRGAVILSMNMSKRGNALDLDLGAALESLDLDASASAVTGTNGLVACAKAEDAPSTVTVRRRDVRRRATRTSKHVAAAVEGRCWSSGRGLALTRHERVTARTVTVKAGCDRALPGTPVVTPGRELKITVLWPQSGLTHHATGRSSSGDLPSVRERGRPADGHHMRS